LDIPAERLQVICTSASFKDATYAGQFAAQLTGKEPNDFRIIKGELQLRPNAGPGTHQDAAILASIDLAAFHAADQDTNTPRHHQAVSGLPQHRPNNAWSRALRSPGAFCANE